MRKDREPLICCFHQMARSSGSNRPDCSTECAVRVVCCQAPLPPLLPSAHRWKTAWGMASSMFSTPLPNSGDIGASVPERAISVFTAVRNVAADFTRESVYHVLSRVSSLRPSAASNDALWRTHGLRLASHVCLQEAARNAVRDRMRCKAAILQNTNAMATGS